MKKFKQVIKEVYLLKGYQLKSGGVEAKTKRYKHTFSTKHIISTTPSKHLVLRQKNSQNGFTEFRAYNPRTRQIDMFMDAKEKKHPNGTTTLKIGALAGRTGSLIKAHDFYHHLITKHNMILQADSQSEGGMKVWRALRHFHSNDVNIHGWLKKGEGSSNQKPGAKDIRQISPGFSHASDTRPGTRDINLIAHKK